MDYGERFELSTEHAASSYGQPVVVDRETGEAIGAADLVEVDGRYVSGAEIMKAIEDA
ncbi:MAG: hypothetical protein KKE79_04345 [Actinobacteria bacterium]|nr:hypothetical protein [Actinomycetota bacterium]MBU4489846.1 hypothetical protein [Actinomycetota bacterium]MCG2795351.1 hypothetical protein [Actinomycetes bacterium]